MRRTGFGAAARRRPKCTCALFAMLIALTAMLCACGMQADIEDATSDAIAYMQAHRAEIDPASKTFVHFFGRKFDRAALRAFGPAAIQEFRDLPADTRYEIREDSEKYTIVNLPSVRLGAGFFGSTAR